MRARTHGLFTLFQRPGKSSAPLCTSQRRLGAQVPLKALSSARARELVGGVMFGRLAKLQSRRVVKCTLGDLPGQFPTWQRFACAMSGLPPMRDASRNSSFRASLEPPQIEFDMHGPKSVDARRTAKRSVQLGPTMNNDFSQPTCENSTTLS
jgi:hypothetical protein